MTVRTIDEIFRDFVTDGVPASGPFNPHKPDIRDTLKALTEGSENFPDNRVIRLNNADEGTANNIVVSASVAIPAAAYQVLYILNVTQENTGPVTVSGAINRDLVTNTSRPIEPGYLKPGMALLCIDTGTELRLLSYGDAEAILAAAEAAADRAEAAAAGLNLPAIDIDDAGKTLIVNSDGTGYDLRVSTVEYNVKTYGASGEGITLDRQAFIDADSDAPAGYDVIVPAGVYNIGSTDLPLTGRRLLFEGDVTITGGGNLTGAIIIRKDPDGSMSFGTGEINQYSARYRFGRTGGGVSGFQIGGAEPTDGVEGTIIFNDGYAGWTSIQPSQYPSPVEVAIQPSTAAGKCQLGNGNNTVSVTSGAYILDDWTDYTVFIEDLAYRILSVNEGSQTFQVGFLNGGSPSFAGETNKTFAIAMVRGKGKCSVNGTNVTRISGDPFVPESNREYKVKINGNPYEVSDVVSRDAVQLSTSAGTISEADYEFYTLVDDLVSAVRVHRISGAGSEENVTLGAYARGYYFLHAASGASVQRPFYIGVGYLPNGEKRPQITLAENGDTLIGGGYDRYSLRVASREGNTGNSFLIEGASAGVAPVIRAEGPDSNIDLHLMPKNDGYVRFGPTIAGHATTGTPRSLFMKDKDGNVVRISVYQV